MDVSAAEIGRICYSEKSAMDYAKSFGLIADPAAAVQSVQSCALGSVDCAGELYETTWNDKRRGEQRGFRCKGCKRKRVRDNSIVNGVVASRRDASGGAEGLFQRHGLLKKRGLMVIWAWAGGKSCDECAKAGAVSRATGGRIMKYLREVCYEALVAAPLLGGPGVTVEVQALQLAQGCFLLGIRTSGAETSCRVFRLPRANRGCILGQLQRCVEAGTTLALPQKEEWAVHVQNAAAFDHTDLTGPSFVETRVKNLRNQTRGFPPKDVVYHSAELWWRDQHRAAPFRDILSAIKTYRPCVR